MLPERKTEERNYHCTKNKVWSNSQFLKDNHYVEKICAIIFFTIKIESNDLVKSENFSCTDVVALTFKYFSYPRTCFGSKITVYLLISKIPFIHW